MSMEYIRDNYKVPAKRGGKIRFEGKPATITGTAGAYLRVRPDGETRTRIIHPTWEVDYAEGAKT